MNRSPLTRNAPAPRAKLIGPRDHAETMLARLTEKLYPREEWGMVREVRSTVGLSDVIRYADAIALHYGSLEALRIHGFEVKTRRSDWLRELADPEKSGPLQLYCAAFWVVVPDPWVNVVSCPDELPPGWGLISVGTGGARIREPAVERIAEQPPAGFVLSVLRNSIDRAERHEEGADRDGVPLVRINRPRLSSGSVGLLCGHVAPRPLEKVFPLSLPCYGCAEDRPCDQEYLEVALLDQAREDNARLRALLLGRRADPGGAA